MFKVKFVYLLMIIIVKHVCYFRLSLNSVFYSWMSQKYYNGVIDGWFTAISFSAFMITHA